MRLGLALPNHGPDALESLRYLPSKLEKMGYSSVWFTDHVIGHESFVHKQSDNAYGPEWFEPLASMAYVAATTETIRLGTGIMVAPHRHPVMAAKILSSIDQFSNGRVIAGIGTGWCQPEFETLGVGDLFKNRGAATNEALEVMQKCWQGGKVSWDGDIYRFPEVDFLPTPVQEKLPLWIGSMGTAPGPMKRVVRFADVWHPTSITPQQLKEGGDMLDDMAGRHIPRTIRHGDDLEPDVSHLTDVINEFAGVGCEEIVLDFTVNRRSLEQADAVKKFEKKAAKVIELL